MGGPSVVNAAIDQQVELAKKTDKLEAAGHFISFILEQQAAQLAPPTE